MVRLKSSSAISGLQQQPRMATINKHNSIPAASVPDFLLRHVISDLETLMVILQKSREDVILTVHMCIKHIIIAISGYD